MNPPPLWKRLLQALHWLASDEARLPDAARTFELDETLRATLLDLAEREQRPLEEVAHDLLQQALGERQAGAVAMLYWKTLTPRQQDVAALVCLGYTNQQIAVRLSISPETVKTHVSNALGKFHVPTRLELHHMLADWDFSAWE